MQEKKVTKTTTPEVKAEVKEAAKAVEKAATDAAKVVEKAATDAAKTTTKKETAKKTITKKAESVVITLHVQFGGKELSEQHINERCIEDYVAAGNKKTSIKTLETYVKAEDNTVYYVVNSTYTGHVVLY